jgi:hypothetical protein
MRKLKLDIQDLDVESFSVASPAADPGTVQGRAVNQPTSVTCLDCMDGNTWTCIGPTYCCPATWQQTCNASCFFTECGWYCYTQIATGCHNTCSTCPGNSTCDHNWTCAASDCVI